MQLIRHLVSAWTWRMAWRDSRASRRRLVLFSCSIVLGIAALAAIGSLGSNLRQAIEEQTKSLLGADLEIHSRDAFSAEEEQWLRGLGGEQSREVSFSSMIHFPRSGGTRLVQVRSLSGRFPFYGALETLPADAAERFRGGGALVDEALLKQFAAGVGDPIQIGKLTTTVVGRLQKVPGETVALSAIAPKVYISMNDLGRTELLQTASLARHRAYFKFRAGEDVPALVDRIRPQLEEYRLGADTVDERKRELGRAMDNLHHFLNMVGFVALLLGAVGVAGAVHVHVKQKLATVAVLRCLGGSVAQTFAVYLAQGMALGLLGAGLGAALGLVVQSILPKVVADFIPFDYRFHTAWPAVLRAMGIGFVICLLFTLLPLLTVRRVSPLAAVRASVGEPGAARDPLRWVAGLVLGAGIVGFALAQHRHWEIGLGFAAGLGASFGILAATAKVLVWAAQKFVPRRMPYAIRQGVANLHRPNNRTLLLLLSLGLGTFLLSSLYLVQQTLLRQLVTSSGANQPNAVLFDIQTAQKEGVADRVRALGLPVLQQTPIVSMRLQSVKGRTVESILSDRERVRRHRWAFRREYRSSYSDQLRDGEKVIAGEWIPRVAGGAAGTNVVPVSLEQGIAGDLGVGLGDELVFDVQGVPVATRVASLREVQWRRIQPNFFVVFPSGVLEEAPASHVLVTHVGSSEESARMQRDIVVAFPNVSAIDLTLVLKTVDTILDKISFVIRFLAMFTVLTGFLVLVTSLLTGRYQRIRESVLLRTLGASRGQVFRILLVEYFVLGLLSAMTGLMLALAAAWALARFVFEMPFVPEPGPVLLALGIVPAITVATGLLMSRGVMNHPPLAVLRAEA